MKQILITLSFAILSFAVACKNSDPVTPDFTGKYAVYVNGLITIQSTSSTLVDVPQSVEIKKGKADNELLLVDNTGLETILTMDGNTFSINPQGNWYKGADGKNYIVSVIGDGAFVDNKLTLHYTGESTEKALGMKMIVTIRGKKN